MYNIDSLPEYFEIKYLQNIYDISINIIAWVNLYGTSNIRIYFVPPQQSDSEGYFVHTTITNNILLWEIAQEDIAILGRGRAVVILDGNNKIKKSKLITVVIH